MFESDFEGTDEEEEVGGDEERDSIAERYIQEEERKMRVRISKKKLFAPEFNHDNHCA